MDFARGLFGDNQCNANPIAKTLDSLLAGGKPIDAHFREEIEDAFEDLWDHAEIQEPDFDDMWDHHTQFQEKQEQEPEPIRDSTHSILQALEAQKDPKFINSEFYSFIKKLHTGQTRIEGEQLVEDWENLWDSKPAYEEVWKALPEEEEKCDVELKTDLIDDVDKAFGLWNQAWTEAEGVSTYNFQDFNPYLELPNPYEVGLSKLETYENREAVLCFEAELQKNPENSEAWGILVELHLANDEDDKAIESSLRGLEKDPYNSEFLLNLGIAYANNFEHENSLRYMRNWIQSHPDYSHVLTDDIIEAFLNALQISPNDSNVWKALGVLHFKDNQLEQSEEFFRGATSISPRDPTLWNSLGSCLCKKANYDESLQSYYKALELKPNYVKAWANIGRTFWNMGDAQQAARFYLCALSLNPTAEHIYNLLETAFNSMERPDLVEKLEARNPLIFSDEFDVITRETLPKQY